VLTETIRAGAPRLEPFAARVSGALQALEARASAG
jgi:hypothetical protein